jgi:hypothetical protein
VLSGYTIRRSRENLRGYAVLGSVDAYRGGGPGCDGGCSCGGACGGDRALSGITAQQAAQQAGALSKAWPSSQLATIEGFAQAGQFITSTPGYQYCPSCSSECSGQQAPNLQLFQKGSSLALGVTAAGTGIAAAAGAITMATAGIIGAATAGIGAIVGIFSIFLSHHSQAVAKEQSVLCGAVPAANNYLMVIAQGVQSGAATPQQAIDALNSLLRDFKSAVSSVTKMDASHCNAACYLIIALTAIVNYQIGVYQDLAAARAAAPRTLPTGVSPTSPLPLPSPKATPAGTLQISPNAAVPTAVNPQLASSASTPAAAPSALPSWAPIAALLAGGFLLWKAA